MCVFPWLCVRHTRTLAAITFRVIMQQRDRSERWSVYVNAIGFTCVVENNKTNELPFINDCCYSLTLTPTDKITIQMCWFSTRRFILFRFVHYSFFCVLYAWHEITTHRTKAAVNYRLFNTNTMTLRATHTQAHTQTHRRKQHQNYNRGSACMCNRFFLNRFDHHCVCGYL